MKRRKPSTSSTGTTLTPKVLEEAMQKANSNIAVPNVTIMNKHQIEAMQRLFDEEYQHPDINPLFTVGDTVLVNYEGSVWIGRIFEIKSRRYHVERFYPGKTVCVVPVRVQANLQKITDIEATIRSIEVLYGSNRKDD